MPRWLVLLLLLPSAQACSLAAEPVGPGYIEAVTFDGSQVHTIPVEDRGLGADCSLEVPMAIGGDRVVWYGEGHLRWRWLDNGTDGYVRWPDHPMRIHVDDEGIITFQQIGDWRGPIVLLAVSDDGQSEVLRQVPREVAYDWHAQRGTMYNITDIRTGDVNTIDPGPHPEFDDDDIYGLSSDGRYVAYEVHGQGRGVDIVWDNRTQTWQELAFDAWTRHLTIEDGVLHVVMEGEVRHIDLGEDREWSTAPPRYEVVSIHDGWILTGTYATEYRNFPPGLPFPAPGIGVLALAGLALLALRRP